MLIETFMLLAAGLQTGSGPSGQAPAPMARTDVYDAFVATEETPPLRDMIRPAVFVRQGQQKAIGAAPFARSARPIS